MDDFAAAKIAVFAASVLSAIIGVAVLWGAPSQDTRKGELMNTVLNPAAGHRLPREPISRESARAPVVRSRRARAQPHVHVSVRGVQPAQRHGRRTERGRSRRHRALAPRHSQGGHRGDGASHRGVEHHRRARRQPAFRPAEFSAGSGRPAGQRGSQAGAVQRGGAAALHLPGAADEFGRSPTARGSSADFKFTRGDSRPRVTPMPIDYDTVGAFYETLSKNLQRLRRARRREGGVLRRSQSADLAQGNRLPGLRSGHLLDHRAQGVRCHRQPG